MRTIPGTADDYSRCDYDELCSEAREAIDAVLSAYIRGPMTKPTAMMILRFLGMSDAAASDLLKATAFRDFIKEVADGHYDVHGIDARTALELLQRRARKLMAAVEKQPCGECHINYGETCDICGAKAVSK